MDTFQMPEMVLFWSFWICVLSTVLPSLAAAWTPSLRPRYSVFLQVQESNNSQSRNLFDGIVDFPFVAVITEPDACDSRTRMNETFKAIQTAVSTRQVALVSIRTGNKPNNIELPSEELEERVVELTRQVIALTCDAPFIVVVSSDWVSAAIRARAHGIHVKESHREKIPEIRRLFPYEPVIGTSSHSIDSAVDAWAKVHPDYFFAGTCYTTKSHPEKGESDVEGPELPGKIKMALLGEGCTSPVLAIGGIDEGNCDVPVRLGADGIATIRAVLLSIDPDKAITNIQRRMKFQASIIRNTSELL